MSKGQIEALVGFVIGIIIITAIYWLSYAIGLLLEYIIKKLNEHGWTK